MRHIIDDRESPYDGCDDCDHSDEEQVNTMKLMFFENIPFEKVILRKCLF